MENEFLTMVRRIFRLTIIAFILTLIVLTLAIHAATAQCKQRPRYWEVKNQTASGKHTYYVQAWPRVNSSNMHVRGPVKFKTYQRYKHHRNRISYNHMGTKKYYKRMIRKSQKKAGKILRKDKPLRKDLHRA